TGAHGAAHGLPRRAQHLGRAGGGTALRLQRADGGRAARSLAVRRGGPRMTPGMSRAVLGVMLVAMWALLWGGFTVANVFSGALVVVGLYLLFPSTRPIWPRTVLHPGAVARLVVYFVVQLVTST